MAYAKLNDIVFTNIPSPSEKNKAAKNALKGYLCAVTLAQHKSKLIIPFIFKFLKKPELA